jgi:hypothetical protein
MMMMVMMMMMMMMMMMVMMMMMTQVIRLVLMVHWALYGKRQHRFEVSIYLSLLVSFFLGTVIMITLSPNWLHDRYRDHDHAITEVAS